MTSDAVSVGAMTVISAAVFACGASVNLYVAAIWGVRDHECAEVLAIHACPEDGL